MTSILTVLRHWSFAVLAFACEKQSVEHFGDPESLWPFGRMKVVYHNPNLATKNPPRLRKKDASFAASEWAVLFVRFSESTAKNCA